MKKQLLIGLVTAAAVISLCAACTQKDTQAPVRSDRIAQLEAENAALREKIANTQAEIADMQKAAEAIASQPLQKSETSFPIKGKWKITGTGKNTAIQYTAYMTISDISGTKFNASIDWHDRAGTVAKENVKGAYDPRTRQITLTRGYGSELIANVFKGLLDNINGDTFTAYLSENGRDFSGGQWMNGGVWQAVWPENGVDFPEEYPSEEDQFRPQWAWDDY